MNLAASDALIRAYHPDDADAVLELNEANVPDVGPMDRAKLDSLSGQAVMFSVVEIADQIEGAIILLAEGADYPSPNYRWFSNRYPAFVYVDRVMLSEATRGCGIGVELYELAATLGSAQTKPVLLAEVNTVPPNPRSQRFHEAFGFVEVGRERPYGPDEEVAMLARPLEQS